MSAHAVGDGKERQLVVAEERVLVVMPLPTDVGGSPTCDSHLRDPSVFSSAGGRRETEARLGRRGRCGLGGGTAWRGGWDWSLRGGRRVDDDEVDARPAAAHADRLDAAGVDALGHERLLD